MNGNKGFTLIELMVVISIIGILAAIAVPQFSIYRAKAFISEGKSLLSPVRQDIADYYDHTGKLPENNFQAGQASPENIKGKYVNSITVENGIITVLFNDSNDYIKESYIKLSPQINEENPTGPVIWELETERIKSVKKKDRKKRS